METIPIHFILGGLDEKTKVEHILTMVESGLYPDEVVYNCISTIDYPEAFWRILGSDGVYFADKTYLELWNCGAENCFLFLKTILTFSYTGPPNVLLRYVFEFYPKAAAVVDLTTTDALKILNGEVDEAYVDSLVPKSRTYIAVRKKEYAAKLRRSMDRETVERAIDLLCNHYHPFVKSYIPWPIPCSMLIHLLEEPLELREGICGGNDVGYVPANYIDICCGLTRKAD
jgi:hypothetical protein